MNSDDDFDLLSRRILWDGLRKGSNIYERGCTHTGDYMNKTARLIRFCQISELLRRLTEESMILSHSRARNPLVEAAEISSSFWRQLRF